MDILTIYLAEALICLNTTPMMICKPALTNPSLTPVGEYYGLRAPTSTPGYGGDVIVFHEDETGTYAIHRPYTLNPGEQRMKRLQSDDPLDRRITNGCINIPADFYDQIFNSDKEILIKVKP